jgi:hypothetical protein
VETVRTIQQAFGDDAMGVTEIKEWFSRMSADSDQHSGRLSTSQNPDAIDKVRTSMKKDCCLTVREIADGAGISRGFENTIVTEDLGMRRVAAKSVPKLLLP